MQVHIKKQEKFLKNLLTKYVLSAIIHTFPIGIKWIKAEVLFYDIDIDTTPQDKLQIRTNV